MTRMNVAEFVEQIAPTNHIQTCEMQLGGSKTNKSGMQLGICVKLERAKDRART